MRHGHSPADSTTPESRAITTNHDNHAARRAES